ncbi:SDR family oxidoreductase [Halegenticoccus soli]|uniref:SDR family oxidoreductase n=1 Tax=Halegenticoccus soli TaxID=1985678 RepID=UPI000C6EC5C7|nr:SDR family oxidoreductase [Halegenticoccus soli]
MSTDADGTDLTADEVLVIDDERFAPESAAIVTGAASGIGRATAAALAANGLTVVATDVDEDGLEETADLAADIDAAGTVETVGADLTDDAQVEAIVEAAADEGSLRYVANIAGMQHIDPIEEFPMETYDTMHDVMVRAPLLLTKLALPHVRATDDGVGCVGNMCSIHGHVATQDKVAYITSKFALRGLTQSIAAEGGGKIRAFTVSTSYVSTPLVTNQIPDTARERGITEEEVIEDVMLGGSRVKEMMKPVEVANLFVFGFSKHAKHLDGGDLLFDGGHVPTYE